MTTSEDYGVVVGINDYKNPPYRPLSGAKRDAEDFIEWLKDPAGANVPAENIDPFTKLSDANGSVPTLTHLSQLLMVELRHRAPPGKKRIGRRLYLFLSGHGVSPKGELDEAGLVTVDAEDSYPAYLPGKQSADDICFSVRFEEVLLFMDCCRVPHLLLAPFKVPNNEKPDPAADKVRRFYAFATGFGQLARETPHNGVVRGIFSRILLDGLKGAASTDSQGRLTTTQLGTYLKTEMNKIIIDGEPLEPKFPATSEIVLMEGLSPKVTVVHLTFTHPTTGIEVLDGGNNFSLVQPGNVALTADGMRFTLPSDKGYVIRASDSGRIAITKTDQEEIHASL